MFDIGWPELVVIAAVALVVIGPKDMPKAMHVVGTWVGKARRAFHAVTVQIDQLNYEAEMMEKCREKEHQSSRRPQEKDSSPPNPSDGAGK